MGWVIVFPGLYWIAGSSRDGKDPIDFQFTEFRLLACTKGIRALLQVIVQLQIFFGTCLCDLPFQYGLSDEIIDILLRASPCGLGERCDGRAASWRSRLTRAPNTPICIGTNWAQLRLFGSQRFSELFSRPPGRSSFLSLSLSL